MAKLKAPLLSLGASGAIGKALVFFPWKGIDAVREYVIPANPKSDAQVAHRARLTYMVALVHAAMAAVANALGSIDKSAYSLLSSLAATPRTWFNAAVKQGIDQLVKGLNGAVYRGGGVVETDAQVVITLYSDDIRDGAITDGVFHYGTSKTSLLSTEDAVVTVGENKAVGTLTGLINGTKYFIQFRPTGISTYIGANSGIYYGTPQA